MLAYNLVVGGLAAVALVAGHSAASPKSTEPNLTFEQLAAKLRPSTVAVLCLNVGADPILGTGFVIDPNGLVATNAHVVSSCDQVLIKQTDSKQDLVAVVLRRAVERDVAILRAQDLDAPPVTLGTTSDVVAGASVLAVGHPQGLEYTVSDGIVSAIRELGPDWKIIQMTAPISPGSSGGPVVDRSGRVVGMSTLYLDRGQNLNFAVAAEDVIKLLEDVRRDPTPLPVGQPEPDESPTDSLDSEILLADFARLARKAKRYEDATKVLSEAVVKHPNSLRLRLELAELAWAREDYAAAEKYTMEMLVRDSNYPPAHQCLSALHAMAGKWSEARKEAQKAIDLGADEEYRAYAHTVLAEVASESGDYSTALVHFDEASRYSEIALDPQYQAGRAAVLLTLGRTEEANRASEKALSLAPLDEKLRASLREIGLPRRVIILSQDSEWNVLGELVVKGVVRNASERSISYAKVFVEALDSGGTIVGTGWSYVDPTSLLPGMTGSFETRVRGNPQKSSKYRVVIHDD